MDKNAILAEVKDVYQMNHIVSMLSNFFFFITDEEDKQARAFVIWPAFSVDLSFSILSSLVYNFWYRLEPAWAVHL